MIVLKEALFFAQRSIYTAISDAPSTKPHRHEYIEIFYVIDGTAEHHINKKTHVLKAGDLYIIRPNDFHQFKAIETSPLLHRNFFVKLSEFQRICDFISDGLFEFIINHPKIVKKIHNIQVINCFEKQIKLFQTILDLLKTK